MKKMTIFALCLCLTASSILVGCGSESHKEKQEVAQQSNEEKTAAMAEDNADEEKKGDEEEKTVEEPEAAVEYTHFSGGVIIDEEKGDHFEILSMGPDEIGYKVEYEINASGSDDFNYLWMNYCIVNGIRCNVVRDSLQDDKKYGEARYFYIPKEWLDTLGISEVRSLNLKFSIGKEHDSHFTPTVDTHVILYPGEKDDTPYEPVLPKGARTIYEDENVNIILMNGESYYNGGNLIRQNFGVLYLRKSDAKMSYKLSKVKLGEIYSYIESLDSYGGSGFNLTEPGEGTYINEVWNTGLDTEEWNHANLSKLEMIIGLQDKETRKESEISVTVDMKLPENRM